MKKTEIVVPDLIRNNCRQLKGYYVPYVIYKDDFKVNDDRKRFECITQQKCSICGQKLNEFWFIGGPGSLFHPHGALVDSATHYLCGKYALEVCPYLVYNSYNKKLDFSKLQEKHSDIILVDPTVELDRVPLFGFVNSKSYLITPSGNIVIQKPTLEIEFWSSGSKLEYGEGSKIVENYLKEKYNVEPIY